MNIEKSKTYKKLVLDMQNKYEHNYLDFSKGATISPSEESKQQVKKICKNL